MLPLSPVYFVPLGFAVCGSPFVAIGVIYLRKNRAIANWPRVKGRIVTSTLRTATFETLDTFDRNWPSNPNYRGDIKVQTSCSADVRFAYEVDGRTHEATTISREPIGGTQLEVQAWVDRHPPGAEVTVYVDPHDPATAYLEWKRWTVGSLILLIWGGVLVFVGVLVFAIFMMVGS